MQSLLYGVTRQPTHESNRTVALGTDSGSADGCSPFGPVMPLVHCPSQRQMSIFPHPVQSGSRAGARRRCSWGSSHCRSACGAQPLHIGAHWTRAARSCPGSGFASAVACVQAPSLDLRMALASLGLCLLPQVGIGPVHQYHAQVSIPDNQ